MWEPGSQVLPTATGGVTFTAEPAGTGQGNQELLLTHISTFASPASTGEVLSNAAYHFTLTLTDLASGQVGKFSFGGTISGTFTATSAALTNTFVGPTEAKFRLGNTLYLVTIGPYKGPGGPGKLGTIAAYIESKPVGVQGAPEPSSLLLAGLAAPLLALRRWRRRAA
jgi:hypothetical protein